MKKLFFLMAVACCSLAALATQTIYLDGNDIWDKDGAKLIIHSWGAGGDNDAVMTQVSGHIFKADIPDGQTGLLFKRLSPECTDFSTWCNREGYWGKTKDQTIVAGKDLCKITGWEAKEENDWCGDKTEATVGVATVEWSTYSGGTTPPDPGTGDQPTKYWYYKGYIDGGDLVNEAGGFNIFKCGTAKLDVETDAYLFVIYQEKGVAGVEYGAASYVDGPTQATLTTTGKEKLHVTAGSYTLYLYKDGANVILSTQPISGKELVSENCSGGGITAIQHVNATLDLNAPMFDILGRKVNADYKGIVIQNGQKFIR